MKCPECGSEKIRFLQNSYGSLHYNCIECGCSGLKPPPPPSVKKDALTIKIEVDMSDVDTAIKKVNELSEALDAVNKKIKTMSIMGPVIIVSSGVSLEQVTEQVRKSLLDSINKRPPRTICEW